MAVNVYLVILLYASSNDIRYAVLRKSTRNTLKDQIILAEYFQTLYRPLASPPKEFIQPQLDM